jgi:hypothetical protein
MRVCAPALPRPSPPRPPQTGNSHMVLLMAPAGIDPMELRKTRAWIDSRDEEGGDSSASSERSSRTASSTTGTHTGGDAESDGSSRGPRRRLARILERVRRKRGHSTAAAADAPNGAGSSGGEIALAEVGAKPSATAAVAAAGAAEHLTVVVPPEVAGGGGLAAAVAAAAAPVAAAAAAPAPAGASALPPHVSAFAAQAGISTASSQSEAVRLAPVGIITLEDVMEELMQVGQGPEAGAMGQGQGAGKGLGTGQACLCAAPAGITRPKASAQPPTLPQPQKPRRPRRKRFWTRPTASRTTRRRRLSTCRRWRR